MTADHHRKMDHEQEHKMIDTARGEYVPGRRIEIEPVDDSLVNLMGLEPSDLGARELRRRLVQRADYSPHPLTWASVPLDPQVAQEERYRLQSQVPFLSQLAFMLHWDRLGDCQSLEERGSLRDCKGKACERAARQLLEEIVDQADVVKRLLAGA